MCEPHRRAHARLSEASRCGRASGAGRVDHGGTETRRGHGGVGRRRGGGGVVPSRAAKPRRHGDTEGARRGLGGWGCVSGWETTEARRQGEGTERGWHTAGRRRCGTVTGRKATETRRHGGGHGGGSPSCTVSCCVGGSGALRAASPEASRSGRASVAGREDHGGTETRRGRGGGDTEMGLVALRGRLPPRRACARARPSRGLARRPIASRAAPNGPGPGTIGARPRGLEEGGRASGDLSAWAGGSGAARRGAGAAARGPRRRPLQGWPRSNRCRRPGRSRPGRPRRRR